MLKFKGLSRLITTQYLNNTQLLNCTLKRTLFTYPKGELAENKKQGLRSLGKQKKQDQDNKGQPQHQQEKKQSQFKPSGQDKFQMKKDIDTVFKEKFGKTKSELLDAWLEMDQPELIVECEKLSIKATDKHIENIQNLFEYLKKFEQSIDMNDVASPQAKRSQFSQTQSRQNEQNEIRTGGSSSLFKRPPTSSYGEKSSSTTTQQQSTSSYFKPPETLIADVDKAKESLNEQLSKILNKRKETMQQVQIPQQQTKDQQPEKKKSLFYQAADVPPLTNEVISEKKINPFTFDLQNIKESLKNRGSLVTNESQFQYEHSDKKLIDDIFDLHPTKLDSLFEDYKGTSTSVLKQIDFNQKDFQKQPSITKKKILINLTDIRQQLGSNPNFLVQEKNINNMITLAKDNWPLLTDSSKDALKDYINQYSASDNIQSLHNNPALLSTFIEVCEKLDIQRQDALRSYLTKPFLDYLNDQAYGSGKFEQAFQSAKVVQFIMNGKNIEKYQIQKLQFAFYNGYRKLFTKKNVKNVPFSEQMQILKSLPPIEGDAYSSTKSLHYMLLNEILTSNQDKWQNVNKPDVIDIVEKTIQMKNCRDLNLKLRGILNYISTHEFSQEDFLRMFEVLSEDKVGYIDVKLIQFQMIRRNVKTFISMNNNEQIKQTINLLEFLFKKNPAVFGYLQMDMKNLLSQALECGQNGMLKLNDMVKLSRLVIHSLYKPGLYFQQMVLNQKESFKKDVQSQDLYELIEQIIKRGEEREIGFEHLKLSNSRVHRFFKQFDDFTFFLTQRILKDLIQPDQPITQNDLKNISKILSNEDLANNAFQNSNEAEQLLLPVLKQLQTEFQERSNKLQSLPSEETQSKTKKTYKDLKDTFNIDLHQWTDYFESLRNIDKISYGQKLAKEQLNALNGPMYQLLTQEFQRTNHIAIDDVLKLNKAILEYAYQSQQLDLYNTSIIKELTQAILENFYFKKKPYLQSFDKFKKNIKISKIIISDTNKAVITNNHSSIISFLNYSGDKQLAKEFAKTLTNSRNLVGQDLIEFIQMIEKYQLHDIVKQQFISIAPNLMTVENKKICLEYQTIPDANFESINQNIEKLDKSNKEMIVKKYEYIFHQDPELLKVPEASLGPLSKIMSDLLDSYNDEQVLMCLQILGSDKVENYHEEFIKKLYERYASSEVVENMAKHQQKFFFKFAHHWPHFLKNNALLNELIQIVETKQSSSLVQQQSEALRILSNKNILVPELFETHFDTFIKMRDKDRVKEYLKEFLHCSAYIGYTNTEHIQKLTQVFRRIYKSPDQVPINELLDYFIVLALSNAYYKDFDDKSVQFLEQGIDFIEKKYTGLETVEASVVDPISGDSETMKLKYFKSIPSTNKSYNKVLLRQDYYDSMNLRKTQQYLDKFLNKGGQKKQQRKESQETEINEQIQEEVNIEKTIKLDEQAQILNEDQKSEEILSVNAQEVEQLFDQALTGSIDGNQKSADQGQSETSSPSEQEEDGIKVQEGKGMDGRQYHKKEKKIYERKASESLYSEELEFHQYRKKKLLDMDKRSKHLLLFSNINQLNFVDINQSEIARAWAVLFHFRSKTFDSILYDEFESIAMRNTIGKNKGHELFSKFYLKLIEESYDKGFRLNLTTKCEKTGWPIDISFNKGGQDDFEEKTRNKLALYFFLQEEVCLNTKEHNEEPLGLQKVMLKHLQNISDYKVEFITENDFYMNKDKLDVYFQYYVDEILSQKL